jgi:hypothetical protein
MENIMKTEHNTDEVFGVRRELPLNYVSRKNADEILIENLTKGRHLVIYGSSKQGKTSLRKHCLKPEDFIVIHCSNKWSISDINTNILKKSGYEITLSTAKSASGKNKIFAKLKLNFWGNGAEGGTEAERITSEENQTAPLELEPEDVNDIIDALKKIEFKKFIVLEDFHYLPDEVQKDFSVALKAFHEASEITFIIVGVWLEENRLSVYNGDLTGRIFPIDADRWEDRDLEKVISNGEALLNVKFSEEFTTTLIQNCHSSVHIVQETCHQCCQNYKIYSTNAELQGIGTEHEARDLVRSVVNQHTGRYNSFLTQVGEGFQSTELEMHKWLLHVIIKSTIEELSDGLKQSVIRKRLQKCHPRKNDLNSGNVTQALQSIASLQVKKDIKPIVLDYDQTNLTLRVVDRSFLIWLENQKIGELIEALGTADAQP